MRLRAVPAVVALRLRRYVRHARCCTAPLSPFLRLPPRLLTSDGREKAGIWKDSEKGGGVGGGVAQAASMYEHDMKRTATGDGKPAAGHRKGGALSKTVAAVGASVFVALRFVVRCRRVCVCDITRKRHQASHRTANGRAWWRSVGHRRQATLIAHQHQTRTT